MRSPRGTGKCILEGSKKKTAMQALLGVCMVPRPGCSQLYPERSHARLLKGGRDSSASSTPKRTAASASSAPSSIIQQASRDHQLDSFAAIAISSSHGTYLFKPLSPRHSILTGACLVRGNCPYSSSPWRRYTPRAAPRMYLFCQTLTFPRTRAG